MRRPTADGLAVLLLLACTGAGASRKATNIDSDNSRSKPSQNLLTIKGKAFQIGTASWYGEEHDGKTTASGEPFDMDDLTAAHRTLPLGTYVRVTNLDNGRAVTLRVNDRGPVDRGRIIDVSSTAARLLDFKSKGVQRVRLDLQVPVRR